MAGKESTFIFHGAHIEVVHRNDVEITEVVFKTILLFVPLRQQMMSQGPISQ